jgi:hypothetical protein
MKRIRIGRRRPAANAGGPGHSRRTRETPDIVQAKGARADRTFRKGVRKTIAWIGRCLWLAAWTVIRAVKMAHDQQVHMWECVLATSGTAPLTAADPLRWVPSLGGHRLAGSHLPAHDPSETGR